ncbi:MAG: N-acetylglucosamine kinase [Bacillota bacterium]
MAESRSCVIGIDGGASSTRAGLMDRELSILAQGFGGPADHFSGAGGKERLTGSLSDAVSPLLNALARDPLLKLEAVCLGLTGVSIPGKKQAALDALGDLFPGVPVFVISDTVTAWAGAHGGKDGVVVIGGTGSVAYGRSGSSETLKGGFGYLLGDEGGGFRIAVSAISAALRDADGTGPATSLTGVVRGFFGVSNLRQVPGKVYAEGISVDRIAALCPLVVAEADRGDHEAMRILDEAGSDLGRLAVAALKALGCGVDSVSHAGGVFKSGEAILKPFRDHIAGEVPHARVIPPAHSPLIGAGIMAWRLLSSGDHKETKRHGKR